MSEIFGQASAWVADNPWWCIAFAAGILLYMRLMRA